MYRQHYPDFPNGMNSHTRVNYRRNPTFCERISKSLVAFVVGLFLLFGSAGLTFWNEGRAVQTAQSLDEGLSVVVSLETVDVVFNNNNGKLVHLIGPLRTPSPLTDPLYGVSIRAVKLKRTVEMYQWVEYQSRKEINEGSETREEVTYSYSREWNKELIRSQSFDRSLGHENPETMAVQSTTLVAENVQVGAFFLSGNLIEKISNYKQLVPSSLSNPLQKIYDGLIYHSADPANPQIGDIRVKIEHAGFSGSEQPDRVSVIARQLGPRLMEYRTVAGDDIELLYDGEHSPKEIFGKEHAQNTFITWAIRFAGWLLMFIGFGCLTSIITTLVDWIPIVRELIGLGVCAMNMSLSISLSLTVIAIGWIWYRPLLGSAILVFAIVPLIWGKLRPSSGQQQSYMD